MKDKALLLITGLLLLLMTIRFIQAGERMRELEGQILDSRTRLAELRTDLDGAHALLLQVRQRCGQ